MKIWRILMALINCPECQKEISDTVKQCPNCGYSFKKKFNAAKIVIPVIIVVLLAGLGFCAYSLVNAGVFSSRENDVITKKGIISPVVDTITFTENDTYDSVKNTFVKKNYHFEEKSQDDDIYIKLDITNNKIFKNNGIEWDEWMIFFDKNSKKIKHVELHTAGKYTPFSTVSASFSNYGLTSGKTVNENTFLGRHNEKSYTDDFGHTIMITYWELLDTVYLSYYFVKPKN